MKWSDYLKVVEFVRTHWPAIKEAMAEVEQYKGAKTGAEKKAAIMEFAETLYRTVDEDSTTVTPEMVDLALYLTDKMVDAAVALWNKVGKFKK